MQARSFHVRPALARVWCQLAIPVRAHITSFLGDERVAPGLVVVPNSLVRTFADDFACGAPILRAAFPDLARSVIAIEVTTDLTLVRISDAGTHDGLFFDCVIPTGRRVAFEELHRLRIEHDRVVEDCVEIDMGDIVRQLAKGERTPSR